MLAVVVVSTVVFAVAAPFARTPLVKALAFIAAYDVALAINSLLTALFSFGPAARLPSRSLLVLACGYLFDALMAITHALSFPGLFAPNGVIGGNTQTTSWLYFLWHGGFPLFVIGYAALGREQTESVRANVPGAIVAVVALVIVLTLLATGGITFLPTIIAGNSGLWTETIAAAIVLALCMSALVVLACKRPPSVLDQWLIVVMCAWLFDVALSALLDAARYDLGWYAGRAYGLVAACFVLAMLIVETNRVNSQLAAATAQLKDHALDLEGRVRNRTEELSRANRKLSAIIEASPVAIYMLDQNGRVALWNASAERVFGYGEAEALGQLPPSLVEDQMADLRVDLTSEVGDVSATGSAKTTQRRKDGQIIDVLVHWARVNDETGHMLGLVYVVADVTDAKRAERLIAAQQEAIRKLSTPVLQLRDGVLVAPIIGVVDAQRAAQLLNDLLQAVRSHQAKVVVIDVTGLAAVDANVAAHLAQTAQAVRLMGARAIVTGISATVAQTLVDFGIDLGELETAVDLQAGLERAQSR